LLIGTGVVLGLVSCHFVSDDVRNPRKRANLYVGAAGLLANACTNSDNSKRLNFTRPFVLSVIHYQTYGHDILKMNEPILMQIGTSGSPAKGMKRSAVGVKRSESSRSQGLKLDLEV